MGKKVVAVLGGYPTGGALDLAVEAILEGARARRADTSTIYLTEKHIGFCTDCRQCTQEPGPARGKCRQQDDLDAIVSQIEAADAVVLASPVSFGNTSAVFRGFMERLIGCAYWPMGQPAPRVRSHIRTLKAALVATSDTPRFLIPLFCGTRKALRTTARILGAKPVAGLWIGFSSAAPDHPPSPRVLARARRIGRKLV